MPQPKQKSTKLTNKQKELHTFLKAYVKEHKVYASISDMKERFGISRQAIVLHLNALLKKGSITKGRVGVYIPK